MSCEHAFVWLRRGATLAAAFWITGCAHVNRDELAAELDQVRAEFRTSDEAVEERLGSRIGEVEDRVETRLVALEDAFRELEGEFATTVTRFESAIRFQAPVHFGFDESTVRQVDHEILDRFADVVREFYDDALITVEGFTDPAGSAAYNQQLGLRRAEAVKEYLVTSGDLREDRLRTVSYGADEARQVAPGAQGPVNGLENRRVAMVIDFASASSLEGEFQDR